MGRCRRQKTSWLTFPRLVEAERPVVSADGRRKPKSMVAPARAVASYIPPSRAVVRLVDEAHEVVGE
jgi:hypothetical protein